MDLGDTALISNLRKRYHDGKLNDEEKKLERTIFYEEERTLS